MAMPVSLQEVEDVLRPWLGTLFMTSNQLTRMVTKLLQAYAPYRQTLEDLHGELESLMVQGINKFTNGEMHVILDHYHTVRLSLRDVTWMTDDVMGLIFDRLTPFSANYAKLNDYALHVESLSALRVLHQKYTEFMTEEEYRFLVDLIVRIYPPYRYEAWLNTDGASQ